MMRSWPIIVGIGIVIVSGIIHGICSDRWSAAEPLEAATERLARLPAAIGDWDGSDVEIDSSVRHRAQLQGWVQRRYVQRGSGREIIVALVCGRPGPIATHRPEVCYQSAGYRMAGEPTQHDVAHGARPAPFWKGTFVKDAVTSREELRIYWSWYAGDSWQAPREPRLAFASFPLLHKLYVIWRVPFGANVSSASDPCPEFLPALLAEIDARGLTVP